MNEEQRKLLDESFEFITNNLDCTEDKIPPKLIEFWKDDFKIDSENYNLNGTLQQKIFLYAMRSYINSKKGKFNISEEDLEFVYAEWQIKLNFHETRSQLDWKIRSGEPHFKIFDFENYGVLKV